MIPRCSLAWCMLAVSFAGCSSSHGTASVSGTVLYQGKPVDGATVNFVPKSEDPKARGAQGKSDSSGRFSLKSYFTPDEQPAGALPGDYAVIITKIDEPHG